MKAFIASFSVLQSNTGKYSIFSENVFLKKLFTKHFPPLKRSLKMKVLELGDVKYSKAVELILYINNYIQDICGV